MARRTNPLRTLVVFFLGIAVMYGLVALAGSWSPALGLDLEGGTRIRLAATGDGVTTESLDEARGIIDARVNGSGVTEAEVTTEGNKYVVVEVPGDSSQSKLVDVVKRQAQLRFRLVAQYGAGTAQPTAAPTATGSGEPTPSTTPGGGVLLPSETPAASSSSTAKPSPTASPTKKATGKNRAPFVLPDDSQSADPTGTATATDGSSSTGSPTGTASPTATPTDAAAESKDPVDKALAWQQNPDEKSLAAYNAFACGTDTRSQSVNPNTGEAVEGDNPNWPLLSCDDQGQKFLLSVAVVEGTDLSDASAGVPQNQLSWVVNLEFNGHGTEAFAKVSNALVGTEDLFAIVLDGNVLSSPRMDGRINNGRAQISGSFNQESAQALATSLRYGSLPIAFEKDVSVETIGPSLAGNQLSAGIYAGLIGLMAVMIYCLIYYRGLGLVVLASLIVAASITYGVVLLLGAAANFTLTLPGIAGLIVAVGITADSFIVYFERIRDEMRDGKSMRVAVEAGWARARNTCLAADAVSLLAAVVLYIFAAGVVRGFAFALGVSTLIDLVVFFWFTHPMVSWLSRFRFFNQGHKLSGLDAEALGIDKINLGTPATAGGRA
ncbi:protein translocase subunit SecD [Nocardioides agariphilus]|jgi:preprotein translocase subunit SecD|uniref:Protein translocase subunit SecD n=1 Tax=Nocardioides agariphilus TaxID=433664 RepID=A0A930YR98_9ACTN|nr:protein translocase subunit SecD [Nocardioides agariphilus]MBF4770265.1 protein translocase subunit SecD [Nocardioides agariphilus]